MPRAQNEPFSERPKRAGAPGDRAALATLIAASMAGFLGALAGSSVNVALPAIGASLHADAVSLSWVVTAFLVVSASLLLPLGSLADRIGRRRLFVLGLAVSAGTGMASAAARSASGLIALRALMGVGGALQFATSLALVVALTPAARRGAAIGIAISSVYVGLAAGPFVGGILTEMFGWRSVFLVPAAGTLPALALALLGVPDDARAANGQRFDVRGALVYVAGLSFTLFACSRLTTPSGVAMGVLGVAVLVGFIALERRTAQPLIDLRRVLHNRVFVLSNLAAMIHYAATSAVGYFLSLYLQSVRGLGPREAGLVLVTQPVFMALLSPLAGRLSDRVQARWLASGGMLLSTLGLWLLVQVEAATSLAVVVAALVTLGVGFAMFSSPNTNAVVSSVPRGELGVANAVLATMRNVGQALSMASALLLVSVHVGSQSLGPLAAPGLIDAMGTAFVVFTVAALLGALASLARGSRVPPGQSTK
ncbi:MAG: MFS transporter [Polyangiaceae bacterium]|nr:MFS transporter [Polyangiaceae bacterium]